MRPSRATPLTRPAQLTLRRPTSPREERGEVKNAAVPESTTLSDNFDNSTRTDDMVTLATRCLQPDHPMPAVSPEQADDLPARARALLNSVFGLPGFRGAQEEIVRHVAAGGNCLVLMPTGGGKSLCYQLPSLLREGCGIVVSPLIALMRDQVAGLLEAGVRAAVLNSTLSYRGSQRGRAAAARRRTRPALCRAGAAADAALPGAARRAPRSRCSRSTRRIACRNGATISARNISACRRSPSAFPTCRGSR